MTLILAQCCPGQSNIVLLLVVMAGAWWGFVWVPSVWKSKRDFMNKTLKILVVAGVIASVAAILLIRQRAGAPGGVQGPPAQAVKVAPSASGLPRLVDLGSTSCIACKKMAPILAELAKDYAGRLDVEFIDVGLRENEPLAREYGIHLIPTQVFLDAEGYELWRHQGFLSKAEIVAKWNELGFSFE